MAVLWSFTVPAQPLRPAVVGRSSHSYSPGYNVHSSQEDPGVQRLQEVQQVLDGLQPHGLRGGQGDSGLGDQGALENEEREHTQYAGLGIHYTAFWVNIPKVILNEFSV